MRIDEALKCPKCSSTHFNVKREATYLYTYKLETPITEEWSKSTEVLPFLFDDREKISDNDYLECNHCRARFPYDLTDEDSAIHFTILQKAIRSDHVTNPDFLG